MSLFLQILRVVCGLAAVIAGLWELSGEVTHVRQWGWSRSAFGFVALCLALIGSGLFTIAEVWR